MSPHTQHLSGVISQRRRPISESKVLRESSPAYIKARLDAHLSTNEPRVRGGGNVFKRLVGRE
jgi:hypothetical protein